MKRLIALLLFSLTVGIYGQQNDMVRINGGTFTMGSPEDERGRSENEGPQHQMTVHSFSMGIYPVTQAEYQKVTGANPSRFRGAELPVEQVSWFDAVVYCNKRSLEEGLTPAYTINGNNVSRDQNADGYRLPTEAEWEYACRAGTETPYYSGDSVDEAGWHKGNSGNRTHPVGEKQPNPWGLYDMHGNVLEWCWDLLESYADGEQTDPRDTAPKTNRVYRGGCWYFTANEIRSAFRFGNQPNFRSHILGFRLVRSVH